MSLFGHTLTDAGFIALHNEPDQTEDTGNDTEGDDPFGGGPGTDSGEGEPLGNPQ